MKQWIHKKWILLLPVLALSIIIGLSSYMRYAGANAEAITLNQIDYDNMELTLNTKGNAIIYYSTNKSKWYEADGAFAIDSSDGGSNDMSATVTYDISWISATGSTKLYFRGNVNHTTLPVIIPACNKKFKVKFDKANGDFDFDNMDNVEIIRWRKSTDYTWGYIWADRSKSGIEIKNVATDANYQKYGFTGTVQSLTDFEKNVIPSLRVKGTKLIFQTVPVIGVDGKDGIRASKEVAVKIPAKRTAPNIKVNIKKLIVNTTTKQQWVTTTGSIAGVSDTEWQACTKTMDLATIAADAIEGKSEKTLYFRTSATSTNCESKVATVKVPARATEPTSPVAISQSAPTSSKGKAKAKVMFTNVPSESYEYVIIKNGTALNEKTAAWKTIKTAKTITFTESSLPAGSVIYVRVKGVNENVKKGIALKLPSKYTSITVPAYPTASSN